MNYENNPAFLDGFLDALDAWSRPSTSYGEDREKLVAWEAGYEHFHELVQRERARLEALVVASVKPVV